VKTSNLALNIYIASTADQVWQALTQSEWTRRYWFHDNVSDWIAGSRWEHRRLDHRHTVDLAGTVIESSPSQRLVITWGRPDEADDIENGSRVSFDIQPDGDRVRLTVRHSGLQSPRELAEASRRWPEVLSGLKSLLENGGPTKRTAA
jgi:uncharacterized protein YndB with AHSA1/START domain